MAKTELNESRICILVLGMHRSGTSVFTRILNILGASLPADILGPSQNNPTGHWEPEPVRDYNDTLLEKLGSGWDDWRVLEIEQLAETRRRDITTAYAELVETGYGRASFFVLKDPRICRLAPLFLDAMTKSGIEPRIVLPFRNPMEVCESLAERDGMAIADAALLWLGHILDAEAATRGFTRAIVSYENLLGDWKDTFRTIYNKVNLDWPAGSPDLDRKVEEFVQTDLRHHRRSARDIGHDPLFRLWIGEAYGALQALENDAHDQNALSELDRIRTLFNGAAPVLHALLATKHASLKRLRQQFVACRTELAILEELRQACERSTSWRITAPIRFIGARLRSANFWLRK